MPSTATNHTESIDNLLSKLREILVGYGIRGFAVYTLDGDTAHLAFSSGVAVPMEAGGLAISSYPQLQMFLRRGDAIMARETDPSMVEQRDFFVVSGATAIFRLAYGEALLGFVASFGEVPSEVFAPPTRDELLTFIAFFSGSFAQRRAADRMRRDHARQEKKLRSFEEAMDILLLSDRQQILQVILQRSLASLASTAGMIWLCNAGKWLLAQAAGVPSTEGMADMEGLLRTCLERGRAGLVSALSGEPNWDFDVDTIHMASVVVFPLRTRGQMLGCLVTFDATVSSDVIDSVEATALIGATAIESWRNAQRMLEEQRLREQVALVAKAQQRLLPTRQTTARGLSLAYHSQYCDAAGGDYVDTIASETPYLSGFVVADVAGHGIGAAMMMVDVRARLRTFLQHRSLWWPDRLLTVLNRAIAQDSAPEEFVTLFLAALDTRAGVLRYSSAGHEPPLLFAAATGTWRTLPSTGLALGMVPEATIGLGSAFVAAGDILVIATDGATEAQDRAGQAFGTAHIAALVQAYQGEAAGAILEAIVRATQRHCEGVPFVDDVTYLVAKVENITLQICETAPNLAGELIFEQRLPPTLAAKDACVERLRQALETLRQAGDNSAYVMCLDEALTNALVHGAPAGEEAIRVRLQWAPEGVATTIAHAGRGFDPRQHIPERLDPHAIQRTDGRGILLMISLCDRVVYWDEGRAVALLQFFPPSA